MRVPFFRKKAACCVTRADVINRVWIFLFDSEDVSVQMEHRSSAECSKTIERAARKRAMGSKTVKLCGTLIRMKYRSHFWDNEHKF